MIHPYHRHFPARPYVVPHTPPPPDIEPSDPLPIQRSDARVIALVIVVFWLGVAAAFAWMRATA